MPSHLISLVEAPSRVLSCSPGKEAREKKAKRKREENERKSHGEGTEKCCAGKGERERRCVMQGE
jgi:hypothetical protein